MINSLNTDEHPYWSPNKMVSKEIDDKKFDWGTLFKRMKIDQVIAVLILLKSNNLFTNILKTRPILMQSGKLFSEVVRNTPL